MKRLNVITLIGALMITMTAMNSYADCLMNEQGYVNISGEYFAISPFPPYPILATSTLIYQKGGTIIINNGSVSDIGTISGYTVTIPKYSLTATFANNCTEIFWSNTSVWVRK